MANDKGPEFSTRTAPSKWAAYLVNGKRDGLSAAEVKQANAMVLVVGMGMPVDCEDAGFRATPDFGEPGDCQAYRFIRT